MTCKRCKFWDSGSKILNSSEFSLQWTHYGRPTTIQFWRCQRTEWTSADILKMGSHTPRNPENEAWEPQGVEGHCRHTFVDSLDPEEVSTPPLYPCHYDGMEQDYLFCFLKSYFSPEWHPKISTEHIWILLFWDWVHDSVVSPSYQLLQLCLVSEGGCLGSVVLPTLLHALAPVIGQCVEEHPGHLSSKCKFDIMLCNSSIKSNKSLTCYTLLPNDEYRRVHCL